MGARTQRIDDVAVAKTALIRVYSSALLGIRKEYCAHVTEHFAVASKCKGSWQSNQSSTEKKVILCFDKSRKVPPVNAVRKAVTCGDLGKDKTGGGKAFNWNALGRTPPLREWQGFL